MPNNSFILTNNNILYLLKNYFNENEIKNKLNKILNRENIKFMNEIINIISDSFYPYLIFNILYENISIYEIYKKIFIDNNDNIFEELKNMSLSSFEPNANNMYEKYYIYDNYIKNIYFGRKDIICYSDIYNINEIYREIYEELTEAEKELIKTIFNSEEDAECKEKLCTFITRINDGLSFCDKNLYLISYIMNFDRHNYGDNIPLPFIGISNDNMKTNRNNLISIFNKILSRTINY